MAYRSRMLLACAALVGLTAGGLTLIGLGADANAQDGRDGLHHMREECRAACGYMKHMRGDRWHRWDRHDGRDFRAHRFDRRRGGFVASLFQRYDPDDTGRINITDMMTIRGDELKKFDKNGDGQLDLQEYEALWLDRHRVRMVRAFQHFDRDGNAQVTTDEYNRPIERLAKRLDRDKDGVIERKDRRGGPRAGRTDDTRAAPMQDQGDDAARPAPMDDDADGNQPAAD
ncbi:hypothetical protein [Rhodoligotrophos ferricapiens]|uniref:hypothetical protein n=1 Tax=Rhodoligotrophos ferricapiens TaxID=3069264 RepID=UPI00315CDF81